MRQKYAQKAGAWIYAEPWSPDIDMANVSVSHDDLPCIPEGKVATDQEGSQWYINPIYFERHYEEFKEQPIDGGLAGLHAWPTKKVQDLVDAICQTHNVYSKTVLYWAILGTITQQRTDIE